MGNIRLKNALRFFREDEESEERIKKGIEKNRKGDFSIEFNEIPDGTKVKYKLVKHSFKFGANIFMLDQFDSDKLNSEYRDVFPKLFNLATLPFYWKDQEPEKGCPRYAADSKPIFRRPPTDLCLEYCLKKNIEPKAHCLNYDHFRPEWLESAEVEEHKKALSKRFKELAERYSDRIPSWEVLNETFNDPYDIYSKFYGEPDFASWSFKEAKKYFPNNKLIINDHVSLGCMMLPHGDIIPNRSAYYMQIKELTKDPEIRLDSIGFQYHSFFAKELECEIAKYRYNPANLFRILDEYANLGRRMQITEMTIPAYGQEAENEETQAELIRSTYRLFFSLPSMEAIIYWNLNDGGASGGENNYLGGLMHSDLTKKPAFEAIEDLLREWHTEGEAEVIGGKVNFRGFYGDYEIKINDDSFNKSFRCEK